MAFPMPDPIPFAYLAAIMPDGRPQVNPVA